MARAQIALQGVVRKGACFTTDGSRGRWTYATCCDKFTSSPPIQKEHVPVRRQRDGKENQKGYSHRKRENTNMIKPIKAQLEKKKLLKVLWRRPWCDFWGGSNRMRVIIVPFRVEYKRCLTGYRTSVALIAKATLFIVILALYMSNRMRESYPP